MSKYWFLGICFGLIFSISVADAHNFKETPVPHDYANAMCGDYEGGAWKCFCLNWSDPSPSKKTVWMSTNPKPQGLGLDAGVYVNSNKCKPVRVELNRISK